MFPQFVIFVLKKENCGVNEVIRTVKDFASSNGYNVTYELFGVNEGVISIFDDFETFIVDIELTKESLSTVTLSIRCFSCPVDLVEKIKNLIR